MKGNPTAGILLLLGGALLIGLGGKYSTNIKGAWSSLIGKGTTTTTTTVPSVVNPSGTVNKSATAGNPSYGVTPSPPSLTTPSTVTAGGGTASA